MSDLPFSLAAGPALILGSGLDRERKIERALEALGPLADRDVLVVGGGPAELERYAAAGARVTAVESLLGPDGSVRPDGSADTIVSAWSAFAGVAADELAAADRLLRPGGRLLVVHDYGRDDVSRVRGDRPEYAAWSRRDGPFLANGFRVRVIHCFWTFETLDAAAAFMVDAFGADGAGLASGLKRPRLSYNVAIYHRSRGAVESPGDGSDDATD